MAVPAFLNTTICDARHTRLLVTDVNTILAALTAQLVTAPAAAFKWTEAPAGTFTSPADPNGRTITCAFSRIAATNLQMILTDDGATTICTRRIQVDGTGTFVDLFTGAFYVFISSLRATTEPMFAFLVDSTPDTPGSVPNPAFGNAYRSNADAADGNCDLGEMYGIDNAGVALLNRIRSHYYTMAPLAIGTPQYPSMRRPLVDALITQDIGGSWYWVGRPYQMLLGYATAVDVRRTVAIDNGVTAVFRGAGWTNAQARIYVRES